MNKTRRAALDVIVSRIEDVRSDLDALKDEEQDYYDNMPESLQGSEKGEQAEETVSTLEDVSNNLGDVIDQISNVA